MAFEEHLNVEIETSLDAKAFRRLQMQLSKTRAQMAKMFQGVTQADAFNNIRQQVGDMQDVFDEAGLEVSNLNNVLAESNGNVLTNAESIERLANAKDRLARGVPLRQSMGRLRSPMQMTQGGFDPGQFEMPSVEQTFGGQGGPNIQRSLLSMGVMNEELNRMSTNLSGGQSRMARFTSSVKGAGAALGNAAPNARALQMRLLGLQFTMMTVAFIFGGLMASALGAVGVFKVLGNTLKFLFLPTALNVLTATLGFQDAIMDLDEGTRRLIGDTFLWIAAITLVISIVAVLGKALVTVAGFLGTVGSIIGWLITQITGLGGAASGLYGTLARIGGGSVIRGIQVVAKIIGSKIAGAIKTVVSLATKFGSFLASAITKILVFLGPVLSFVAGLIGGFLAVVAVAKVFGKKVALVFGAILIVIGAVVAAIVSIPAVIAAAIGLIIGAILGLIWTFRDEIVGAIQWIVKKIVGFFEWLYNVLVGNSIIPDLVKGIIEWFMKLPGMALDVGRGIVDALVRGIKGIGNGIWNAFKKVLPDFLVDALEGVGNFAGKVGGSVASFGEDVFNGAQNFASGISNTVGGFFGGGNNNQGGATVQQNTINAEVQVNDKEETPQETGRQFGEGAAEGLNQRTNNTQAGF